MVAHERTIGASINPEPPLETHLEMDAMYAHQITTSRRLLLGANMVRPAGEYNGQALEALRAFLADLAWSDQGE